MSNTILIKRRKSGTGVGALSGGELAFNEHEKGLYIQTESNSTVIGGEARYITLTETQTISAASTFHDTAFTLGVSAVTQPKTTSDNTIATTAYVHSVFEKVDSGEF
jgi:hypothetical protein